MRVFVWFALDVFVETKRDSEGESPGIGPILMHVAFKLHLANLRQ